MPIDFNTDQWMPEPEQSLVEQQKAAILAQMAKDKMQFGGPVYIEKEAYKPDAITELIQNLTNTNPVALQPINAQPTDNPSTQLLKELFSKVLNIVKKTGGANTGLGSKIVAFVCKDTPHSNLAIYQSDFNIPIAFKIHKYSCVIQASSGKSLQTLDSFNAPSNYTVGGETTKELKEKLEQISAVLIAEQDNFAKYREAYKIDAENKPRIVEVRASDGTMIGTQITAQHHKQLPEILQALTARNAQGFPEQLYIWGAPGAGKTHLSKQIAAALGVRCFAYPMGPTITEGKLLGFNNIATGSFVPGWLYDAYKNGGLVALDEADLADASVLGAANSIDNDCFIFGNGELVMRNANFYLIAFANTIGTGSTKGFIRNTLDAATRDRFTVIKLDYDERLEREIYGNADWAIYVQKIREYVTKHCQASIYITPRATRKGAAYLQAGIPVEKVLDWCIFKGCSEDLKTNILQQVGKFNEAKQTVYDNTDFATPQQSISSGDFIDSFNKLAQSLSLSLGHKIYDIKQFRNWYFDRYNLSMSLAYAKSAIENWTNYYSAVIESGLLPSSYYGFNINQ